jgi:hypothetical protein
MSFCKRDVFDDSLTVFWFTSKKNVNIYICNYAVSWCFSQVQKYGNDFLSSSPLPYYLYTTVSKMKTRVFTFECSIFPRQFFSWFSNSCFFSNRHFRMNIFH